MADEEIEVEGKKKSPIIKIAIIAVLVIVVLIGTVAGTLVVSGFFDKKDTHAAEQALKELEEKIAESKAAEKETAHLQKVTKDSTGIQRFESTYMELEKPLVSNLTNTRKVIQLNLAIMTHYDERVFKNVKKHEFALRSQALDVMRQMTEADLADPQFRKNLADKIRDEMNGLLQKFEDFGGIEEVYFTSFVVQ